MKNANFIAFDFETSTIKEQMPCQIGISVVQNGEIVKSIERLIQPPENKYSKRCIGIHGITPDKTKDAPTFDIVWNDIKEYFEANFIIAHNISFDVNVLRKALEYYNIPFPIIMGYECTYAITGLSLNDASKAYGIKLDSHHNGACDAEACAKIFIKYLNGEIARYEYVEAKQVDDDKPKKDDIFSVITNELLDELPPFFKDLRFIITGETVFDRDNAYNIIKKLGGKKASVSKSLDYVIQGIAPGPSKMENIRELNAAGADIKIISDFDFINILADKINLYADGKIKITVEN